MGEALVAKSYIGLEQVTEPYSLNGKMYVKVRMKNGNIKQVRAYSAKEYAKYNPEVKVTKPIKSRREVFGFGEKGFIGFLKVKHMKIWIGSGLLLAVILACGVGISLQTLKCLTPFPPMSSR